MGTSIMIPAPNQRILAAACSLGGIREVVGDGNSIEVMEMFASAGARWVKGDSTAWCSAAACHIAHLARVHNPRTIRARNWLVITPQFCEIIPDSKELLPGDFVVLRRGNNRRRGHIGVYLYRDGSRLVLLGGNQSDMVCARGYSESRFLGGIRMAEQ